MPYLKLPNIPHSSNKILLFSFFVFFNCLLNVFSQEKKVEINDTLTNSLSVSDELVLNDNWQFYWNKLINPEEFNDLQPSAVIQLKSWSKITLNRAKKLPSFGYATYRKIVKLSEHQNSLSLSIPAAYASSKTWINGELIAEIGKVGTTKNTTIHRRKSQIIPIKTNQTSIEIVIQVANFYHAKAGFTQPLKIDLTDNLLNKKSNSLISDMLFISSIGFIGLFFLLFYLFFWNKDKAVLYFAMLCISLTYMTISDRYAPIGDIFPTLSFTFLTKIEYIALFLVGFSANYFFSTIFHDFIFTNFKKIVLYLIGALIITVIVLPPPYFTKVITPFLLLLIFNLIYVSYVIIKVILKKRKESFLLFSSMLLGLVIFYGHLIFFLYKNHDILLYINFGYVLSFLLFSMLLMTRFASAFKELEKSKEHTMKQQKEIIQKSDELSNLNLELEENLKLLENYNTELDNFNHIVSHDLKAPLISMSSLLTFFEEDLKVTLDSDSKNYLTLIKDKVFKMYTMVNSLLEYSKVTQGEKRKDLFSLNVLIEEIIQTIESKEQHTINLPKTDIEIYTSRLELKHVFQNLITNAIKHNDKETAVIDIFYEDLGSEYLFEVSDNGPGIEEKYRSKIFDIFTKLDTDDTSESTGIGLSIVKKIVSQNKGTIQVETNSKKGTSIKFSWIKTNQSN